MKYLLCSFLLMSCYCWGAPPVTPDPTPAPTPAPEPPPAPDPVPERPRTVCRQACDNMALLRCKGWEGAAGKDEVMGTPDDVPCAQVCTDYEVAAASLQTPAISLHPACVAAAGSCADAVACFQ